MHCSAVMFLLSVCPPTGAVELENLPLRRDALREFNLPFEVKAGQLHSKFSFVRFSSTVTLNLVPFPMLFFMIVISEESLRRSSHCVYVYIYVYALKCMS